MIGRFRQEETESVEEPRGFDDFDLRLGDVMRGERATMGKSLLDVQRELKIKATYIAAIENADPSAFETPGFIAGYVRSYARYLELDPEWAYRAFCVESDFETAHGMSQATPTKRAEPRGDRGSRDPFGETTLGLVPRGDSFLSRIEPGAIGSLAVLIGLIGVIGYGGYTVLNEIQKVQFVPVEQAPELASDLDPLIPARTETASAEGEAGAAEGSNLMDRLYQPRPLDLPVMEARDGPISTIDPNRESPHPERQTAQAETAESAEDGTSEFAGFTNAPDASKPGEEPVTGVQVVADAVPEVVLFAVRPSWVRVRSSDGTTIYEQIMDEGDRFVLPKTEEPATLRTGESGAIYFAINGEPYGPAGRSGAVTSNLSLDAGSLTSAYEVADLEADTALARVLVELEAQPPQIPPSLRDETAAGESR